MVNNNINSNLLPRRDLREPAFRKYEPFLERAMLNPITEVNCRLELQITSSTFVARLRDAMLGFSRYKYQSHSIPPDTNFYFLKLEECADDIVRIYNTILYQYNSNQPPLLHITHNHPEIMEKIRLLTTTLPGATSVISNGPYYLTYDTPAERESIRQLSDEFDVENGLAFTVRDVGPNRLEIKS